MPVEGFDVRHGEPHVYESLTHYRYRHGDNSVAIVIFARASYLMTIASLGSLSIRSTSVGYKRKVC